MFAVFPIGFEKRGILPDCLRKISRQFTKNPRTVHRKLMVFRTFLRSVSAWADRIKAIKDEGGYAYDSGNI